MYNSNDVFFFEKSIPTHLVAFWLNRISQNENRLLSLESFNFSKFPDGMANRLHHFNFFKLNDAEVEETAQLIIEIIEEHGGSKDNLLYGTAWANVLKPGQSMGIHNHKDDPSRLYSGVIFLTDSSASLKFYNSSKKLVESVQPKYGTILIFPSHLDHEVESNSSDSDRISLVFDIADQLPSSLWLRIDQYRPALNRSHSDR